MTENENDIDLVLRLNDYTGITLNVPRKWSTDLVSDQVVLLADSFLSEHLMSSEARQGDILDNIVWDPPNIKSDTRFCDLTTDYKMITANIVTSLPSTMNRPRILETQKENLHPNTQVVPALHRAYKTATLSNEKTLANTTPARNFEGGNNDVSEIVNLLLSRDNKRETEIDELRKSNDDLSRNFNLLLLDNNTEIDELRKSNKDFFDEVQILRVQVNDLRAQVDDLQKEKGKNADYEIQLQSIQAQLTEEKISHRIECCELRSEIKELSRTVAPLRRRIALAMAKGRIISLVRLSRITTWQGILENYKTPVDLVNQLLLERMDPLTMADVDFLYNSSSVREDGNMSAHEATRGELRYILLTEEDEVTRARWSRIIDFNFSH